MGGSAGWIRPPLERSSNASTTADPRWYRRVVRSTGRNVTATGAALILTLVATIDSSTSQFRQLLESVEVEDLQA